MLGATDPKSGQGGQQVSGRGRHPRSSLLRNDKMEDNLAVPQKVTYSVAT